jgi:hypothetical protein
MQGESDDEHVHMNENEVDRLEQTRDIKPVWTCSHPMPVCNTTCNVVFSQVPVSTEQVEAIGEGATGIQGGSKCELDQVCVRSYDTRIDPICLPLSVTASLSDAARYEVVSNVTRFNNYNKC